MATQKPDGGQELLFNPHFFKDPFQVEVNTRPLKKEALLMPGIFFDDEFKDRVLRYVPSVVPPLTGTIYGADFAKDMTPSEAYARTAENIFTPREFIATLAFCIAHDRRMKKEEKKILRTGGDSSNIFCVRSRGRLVSVWVDMNLVMDHFEGIGVHGFYDVKSPLEDDGEDRWDDVRFFV
ncbi:MAG: hypothetical protein AAB920_01680 [Patescibacteria group bacterium]